MISGDDAVVSETGNAQVIGGTCGEMTRDQYAGEKLGESHVVR